jgi:hypothetical protein
LGEGDGVAKGFGGRSKYIPVCSGSTSCLTRLLIQPPTPALCTRKPTNDNPPRLKTENYCHNYARIGQLSACLYLLTVSFSVFNPFSRNYFTNWPNKSLNPADFLRKTSVITYNSKPDFCRRRKRTWRNK